MAKEVSAGAQKYAEKQVAAALKAERARVKAGVAAIELPEGTTARAGADIKRALKAAVAPE